MSKSMHVDDWRESKTSLKERVSYFFNNELASDVKFLVQGKYIPAHKFVLIANSPVFYAMFNGPLAESGDVIKITDCEQENDFMQFMKYLYTEKCDLNWTNVFNVLYFSKKYLVSSLTKECVNVLSQQLQRQNVLHALKQAMKFAEDELIQRCLKCICPIAEEIIRSDEFLTLDIEALKVILAADELNVAEVNLFKAVDKWSIKRMQEKMHDTSRLPASDPSEVRRSILGDALFLIRFPVMTASEFAANCAHSGLLTSDECRDIFCYIAKLSEAKQNSNYQFSLGVGSSSFGGGRSLFRQFNEPQSSPSPEICLHFPTRARTRLHGILPPTTSSGAVFGRR